MSDDNQQNAAAPAEAPAPSTPPATPPKKFRPRVARGREQKKRAKTYLLQVQEPNREYPDGVWFRMKRIDFFTLVMDSVIPTPLLSAVDRLQEVRRSFAGEGEALVKAMDVITNENKTEFFELMRRVAVAATLEPRLTHSKSASMRDEDLVWIGGKSDVQGEEHLPEDHGDVPPGQLMMIWRSALGEAGVVVMSDDDAEEFRTDESRPDADTLRDGGDVRTEAVVLDPTKPAGGGAVLLRPEDPAEHNRSEVQQSDQESPRKREWVAFA